ncbi:hypothetical protein [uncultured Corynebacterium sp.]|nr:hypothetical protein [uncultured Corynebacterium sp.]
MLNDELKGILQWGQVDTGYTQDEMNALFDAHVASLGKTAREYLEEK